MIANLITLADFAGIVPFSVNIDPRLVDPHIADAQQLDFWPLLPDALRAALATDRATWPPALTTLFADYLKRLLVLEAARRMLLWHGLHITPSGCENTASLPITDQQRSQLRADLAAKASYYRPLAEVAIRAAYPLTTSACGTARARRPHTGGFQSSAV